MYYRTGKLCQSHLTREPFLDGQQQQFTLDSNPFWFNQVKFVKPLLMPVSDKNAVNEQFKELFIHYPS